MTLDFLLVIKKILKAKSTDLYDHSVFTAQILETLVNVATSRNYSIPISSQDANTLGLLHDIGKVYINDVILNKQESLSDREWESIKLHPTWGKQFVEGTIFAGYGKYIIQHHEKIDGSGYPNKLKGNAIHELSHIINMADQMASLIENRPYKRGIQDKLTLLSIITPNINRVFGSKTKCVLSQTIDIILQTDEQLPDCNVITDNYNDDCNMHNYCS